MREWEGGCEKTDVLFAKQLLYMCTDFQAQALILFRANRTSAPCAPPSIIQAAGTLALACVNLVLTLGAHVPEGYGT